jgi:5'-3' exonuclease
MNNAAAIKPSSPVLFIDLSYYVFYRFYALLTWYKMSQQEPPDIETISTNTPFLQKFEKMFVDNLYKLQKKYQVPRENLILVRDCVRGAIWRREVFPNYKENRADKSRDFNGYVFVHTYESIIPKLGYTCVGLPSLEADDIIGGLKTMLRQNYPKLRITIITNDQDYAQLADSFTGIYNLRGQDLTRRGYGTPHADLMMKVILGDVSDNIPGVFKRCSKKQALCYVQDPDSLEEALRHDQDASERYVLNRRLVDLSYIPDNLKETISHVYHLLFTQQQ